MRELPLPTLPIADIRGHSPSRRSLHDTPPDAAPRDRSALGFEVVWARHEDEVRQAQRLRYLVFAEEMGARLSVPQGSPVGHDIDMFDPFCEHLLVRATGDGSEAGQTRLRPLRERMVELGRSCVHPAHRSGGAILALWGALAEFMDRNKLDTMIGCASVSMRDGGHYAASLWQRLRQTHMAAIEWQVRPRLPLPVDELQHDLDVEAPALIKGYLRCGAKVLGAPAWDPDFNTADLPMLMRIAELPSRYRRHFLGR